MEVGAHKGIEGLDEIDKVIAIDQTPIGRNPRSNPATYIKLFDEIRDLFSQLPESRARGYEPGRFSFNVKEGSCSRCSGMGMVVIDMDFLEDAWIECPVCHGKRFDHETLSVLFKGKNIYDILEMDVSEALELFDHMPSIKHKLETLRRVGMEYIKLGQSSTTLSGGEAQRIKLAKELVRPATGRTLYIFDEPTTGLHFHDIQYLLGVLHELVERGNTVVVIEHNMDVVKTADWIIDIGPEGGEQGGTITATGKPEAIAKKSSPTGTAVREALTHDPASKVKALLASRKKTTKPSITEEQVRLLSVRGAEQNNLKCIDVDIPREKITVCSGPSGSGKTSLAFETIYAEGQRRYIESLSPYARQFVKQMPKPKVSQVEGLSPAIAIEQKSHAGNPRSTVGTMTEIYDYLRVLFARVGVAHCPETGEIIKAISKDHVVERLLSYPNGEKLHILAPLEVRKGETFEAVTNRLKRQGYLRIRLNNDFYNLDDDTAIPYDRRRKNTLFLVVDRLKVDASVRTRLLEAIENASEIADGQLTVLREDGEEVFFNLTFSVESTGKSYPEITPHTFSFNTMEGMCPECQGIGVQYGANLTRQQLVMKSTVGNLIRLICKELMSYQVWNTITEMLKLKGITPSTPMHKLTQEQLNFLLNGSNEVSYSYKGSASLFWIGINNLLVKAAKSASNEIKELIIPLLDEQTCPACDGSRLNALARHVTIDTHNIADICRFPIERSLHFVDKLALPETERKFLDEVKKQLVSRLSFLHNVGLGYLSLNRTAPTLSGGEAQRIRLARQLGSGLTGVLYVLDEPTIGLHPRDNERLNQALFHLRDLGNTILMVEHDPLTITKADYLLDFGPRSGRAGGHITAQGLSLIHI